MENTKNAIEAPTSAEAYVNRSNEFYYQGDYQAAISDYDARSGLTLSASDLWNTLYKQWLPTPIKNVTLSAKLFFFATENRKKHQRTLTGTEFSNVTRCTQNVTPV